MSAPSPPIPAALAFLAKSGQSGREILAHDWSGHSLGPPASWPPALRSTLATMLACPAAMFLAWGPDGIAFFNDAYRPIFGDRLERALGARFREIWADLWDDIGPLAEATLAGRSTSQRNLPLTMHRYGAPEETWWSFTYSPVRDDDGRINGLICITAETTAEVLGERARQRSEERLDMALSAGGSIGVWDWDVATDRVTADARFARLYGVDPAVAEQGAPIATFFGGIHADDLPEVRRRIEAAIATGAPFAAEYRLVQADGSVRWAGAEGRCFRDATGRPTRFPGVSFDITERKRTEAALRESEDRFRGITDTVEQMIWSTRADGFHDYYNARWYEYTGMPDGSTDGEAWNGMFHHDDQDRAWAVWRESLATGRTYRIEYRLRHRSGQYRWVLGRAKPLRDATGRIVRWFGTCTDIHDRKLAEERQAFLLTLNDTLREAPDPVAVTLAAAAALGTRLNAGRAGYGAIDESGESGETVRVERDWTRDAAIESLAGESRILDGFGPAVVSELRAGRTLTVEDCYSDPRAGRRYAAVWDSIGCRALVVVPLIREGRLRAIVYLHEPEPRAWSAEEVALVEDVAQRVWHAAERARAELAARAQARELRLIADSLPVLIAFFDAAGRCRFANAAGADWFGGTAPDGRGLAELVGDAFAADRPRFEAALAGREGQIERAWPHRDGRRRVAEIRYRPRLTPEGRADGAYLFALDVTDRKRMEEVLAREVDARTRERDRLWQTTNDLMGTAGLDGYLRSVNPAWTRLLGWSEAELLACPFLDLIDPDDHAETGAVLRRLSAHEAVTDFVDRVLRKDGGRRTVMWTAVPEGDRFHIVGRDITQQRLAEEQLRQAQKMEAVGQLTGGIAHDFNNLLTGIVGSLDLMRTRIAQGRIETLGRYIEAALSSAERAAALTHRLLAFARRQPLEQKPVDVAALLAGMDALLRSTLTEGVHLEVTTGPEPWPTLCDSHQLENAILNLAINARDAMPDGGTLRIETANATFDAADPRLPPEIEPGDYVALSVSDTGLGMQPEVVARAFEPFFTTKPMGQGTGLGLSMIYGFARQSGGHVRLESAPGRGTVVRLTLPRHRGAVAAPLEPAANEAPPAGRGETVLVVEDETVVRDLVVETLRDLGYRAIEAQDGPSGLRILRSEARIDLLVTDVGLPGLDGRQLAEQARAGRPDLKVLFITGYAENALFGGDRLDPGMQMITKPFPVKALAARIRTMIELS